jgi:hypothetical protein
MTGGFARRHIIMKDNQSIPVNNRGVAMIVALLVVLALSMLATGVVLITTSEVFVTRNEAYGKEAFYAAEAGLRHAERVLRTLNSRDQISSMYQMGGGGQDYASAPPNSGTWKEFLDPQNANQWVAAVIDPNSNRRYSVYVVNNDPTERDTSGHSIEADGKFFLRSVGESYMGTRKIMEEEIFLNTPIMDPSQDSFGGGPGNLNQQATR